MRDLMPELTNGCLVALTVAALLFALPALFDKVAGPPGEEPLVFYSPVLGQFIYQRSPGSHRFEYRDEEGREYSRQEFEELLPFVYFRNLERRNLLPVTVAGRRFQLEDIAAERQGLEIRARHLRGHFPQIPLYPLFNTDPETAMMPFPEELFRFTDRGMEFVNADFNRVNPELSLRFTRALEGAGFVFPATLIAGRPTNLKPFDDGYFIRDAAGQVFHLRRVVNQPVVHNLGLDRTLDIADIVVSEHERREFRGLIITRQGQILLISWDDYRLIPLPVEGYDPARMDIRLLIDPLYRTLTVSSSDVVFGVAMDAAYLPLHRFSLPRPRDEESALKRLRDVFFPLVLTVESPWRGQADLQLRYGGVWSTGGVGAALLLLVLLNLGRKRPLLPLSQLVPVALAGLPGLIAVLLVGRAAGDSQ